MKKLLLWIPLVLLLFSCGSKYNMDYAVPAENASLDDVFPASIAGMDNVIFDLDLPSDLIGFQAEYGESSPLVIGVIQAENEARASSAFENQIVPLIDEMPTNSRGNINGRWKATGKDSQGRKWVAWSNLNWIFFIHCADEAVFDQAIDDFAFISY